MTPEQNNAGLEDAFKAYLTDLTSFGLLNRQQEVEAFLHLYAEENEYLMHLVSRISIAVPVLKTAQVRMKGANDPNKEAISALGSILRYLKAGKRKQAADKFVEKARTIDPIRSLQSPLHGYGRSIEDRFEPRGAAHDRWLRRADTLQRRVLTAKNWIASCNLRLVIRWAKRYRGTKRKLGMSDLIQEGNIGLLKAIDKFDVSRENRFATYASWWVRQAMRRAVADTAKTIRIPVHMLERLNKFKRAEARHEMETGRKMTREEAARWLRITPEKWDIVQMAQFGVLSLDAPCGQDFEGPLVEYTEDPDFVDPIQNIGIAELREDLDRVMERLSPIEAYIIVRRFGLNGQPRQTLKQIADKYDLSRERIRQLENRALGKMKKHNGVLSQYLPSPPDTE